MPGQGLAERPEGGNRRRRDRGGGSRRPRRTNDRNRLPQGGEGEDGTDQEQRDNGDRNGDPTVPDRVGARPRRYPDGRCRCRCRCRCRWDGGGWLADGGADVVVEPEHDAGASGPPRAVCGRGGASQVEGEGVRGRLAGFRVVGQRAHDHIGDQCGHPGRRWRDGAEVVLWGHI